MKANLLLIAGMLIGLWQNHHQPAKTVPTQAKLKRVYPRRVMQDFKHNGNGETLLRRFLS